MKKFILATLAATVAFSPLVASVAEAQRQREGYQQERHTTIVRRNGDVVQKTVISRQAPHYRNWRRGERFDRRYAQNYRQIDYRQYRGLRAPPRGYHYVRSGNDAVLVGITSGLIAAVVAGAIR
jgi:Ni/Co efflux regulator RcnB